VELSPRHRRLLSGEARGLRPACVRALLALLSIPYGLVVRVRNWLYDTGVRAERRVDRPVLCVGNLTTGGTGKTPAVEYIVRWFRERGARPAILSRGYRARDGRNDEARMLARHLPDVPHRRHPRRIRAALEAIKLDGANVLVLDDGFQHRRLARFANLVVVDATCPFGYGHLLPRGLLREPLAGLRRADAVLVTRCDLVPEATVQAIVERLRRLAPRAPVATSRHKPVSVAAHPDGVPEPVGVLSGKRAGLFCSIGNPAAFRSAVERLGAAVAWSAEFPDHHWYTAADVAGIVRAENRPVEVFVTTEKDAVKLGNLWPGNRRLMVLRVELELLSGEARLASLLAEALRAATYDEREEA